VRKERFRIKKIRERRRIRRIIGIREIIVVRRYKVLGKSSRGKRDN